MKKKRYTTEQIIAILRQADTGKTVEEICRGNNVSEQTFYRWRKKYGNLELADAKRFKELEKENTELKKMLADQMLKNQVMEETVMDLENNAVGITLVTGSSMTRAQLDTAIRAALNNGELTILDDFDNAEGKGLLKQSNQ